MVVDYNTTSTTAEATGVELRTTTGTATLSLGGPVSISATTTSTNPVFASATATGIDVFQNGDGAPFTLIVPQAVSATSTGSVQSGSATGITLFTNGSQDVTVNGALTATGNGTASATGFSSSMSNSDALALAPLTVVTNAAVTATATGTGSATGVSVSAFNFGSGNVSVTTKDAVTATSIDSSATGVTLSMFGPPAATIQTEANVTATGNTSSIGISASHNGAGNLNINVLAGVQSFGIGINVARSGAGATANTSIDIAANSIVTGTTGVRTTGGVTTLTNLGNITGTGGTAVQFAGGNNTLIMSGANAALTGNAIGSGTDTFRLAGTAANTFDVSQIGAGWSAFEKVDAGTWTLTGNSPHAGTMTVNGGTLVVNGSFASSSGLTINGGVVGGTGTLPTTVVNNGATLAPGNSIGTIAVNGNLTFNAGSTYFVEFSPAEADRTNVTGTATINGSIVQATALPGSFRRQSYTIINATGGVSGEFASLIVGGQSVEPTARNPHLTYDANNVFLVLDPGTIQIPAGAGGNQTNVATGINNAVVAGQIPPLAFDALLLMTGQALNNALGQVAGPAPTGAWLAATQMMNGFLSTTLSPWGGAPGGNPGAMGYARAMGGAETLPQEVADAYASVMPTKAPPMQSGSRWSVWGQGFGGYNKTDGNVIAGTADTSARTYGFAVGADYRVSPNTTIGFALAGGEMNWSLTGGLGGGKSDVFQAGMYGSHRFGAAYVSGAIAYAWYDMRTDRNVTIAGLDMLRATFDAHNIGGRLEVGYRVLTPVVGVTPYIAGQVQNFHTPRYAEAAVVGNNTFALSYNDRSVTATRFELGSWFDKFIMMSRGDAIMLRGRAAWAHDDNGNGGLNAAFQTLPGAAFTVNGAAPPKNLALLSAGGEYRFASGFSLGARFDGEFASRAQTYAGTGTVKYAW